MTTIGIDIGGRTHVVARCRDGTSRADREFGSRALTGGRRAGAGRGIPERHDGAVGISLLRPARSSGVAERHRH